MEALILSDKKVHSVTSQSMKERRVYQIIGPLQWAKISFELRLAQATLLLKDPVLGDLAERDAPPLRIPISGNVIASGFVNKNRDFMRGCKA